MIYFSSGWSHDGKMLAFDLSEPYYTPSIYHRIPHDLVEENVLRRYRAEMEDLLVFDCIETNYKKLSIEQLLLIAKLFRNDNERELDRLLQFSYTLKSLFKAELSNATYKGLKEAITAFLPKGLACDHCQVKLFKKSEDLLC